MKRFLTLAVVGLSLAAFGCAGTQAKEDKPVTADTMVKCPKCGAEFKLGDNQLWQRR